MVLMSHHADLEYLFNFLILNPTGIRTKFGAEIVPYYPFEKLESLAQKIEMSSFDYLWVSDHYHNRFVHSVLTRLAGVTEEIKLGPGVTNPYLIYPTVTATAVASLDEISEGRAVLGMSAGDPAYLRSVGIEQRRPITTVREAFQIIRNLLEGGRLTFSGEVFSCEGAKLRFSPSHYIPIYIGGRKRQMMELAGSVADGGLFNSANVEDVRECLEFVKKGAEEGDRKMEDFQKVVYVATSIGRDEGRARDRARTVTSFITASAPKSSLERERISEDRVENIKEHLRAGDLREARREVTGRMIEAYSITGSVEKLEERIEEFKGMGIDQIVIGSPMGPDINRALETIGELVARYS